MPQTVTVGVIVAPELAETLVTVVSESLPGWLAAEVDDAVSWEVRVCRDALVGAGGSASVLSEIESQGAERGWDLAVAVTDLPLRSEGRVLVAEVSQEPPAGVISLPALGVTRLRTRVREAITSLVRDLHDPTEEGSAPSALTSGSIPSPRITEPSDEMSRRGITVRYAIPWKRGHVKLVAGLVRANSPLQVLGAFKGALAATFATAAYAMIFPSAWKLSDAMGFIRPILIMVLSLVVMVAWIIAAHGLWERPRAPAAPEGDAGLARLYNTVTATTLALVTAFGYLVLFVVIFGLAWLFIPMPYFGEQIAPDPADVGGYLSLSWLLASLAMLAAALGQGLDDDETARKATFGYRQRLRARQREHRQQASDEANR